MSDEPSMLDIALQAADAGDAGHWPTVAGILADEYRKAVAQLAAVSADCETARAKAWDAHNIIDQLKAENAALRAALVKIRNTPTRTYGDHWCNQEALDPETIQDICDEAIDAARKEEV